MQHIFKKNTSEITLVLLHGTGGNEHDLLPIAKMIDPDANVLSIRGQILENGMPRFFKRLKAGVFDEKDLIYRTHELKGFIDEASVTYSFDRDKVIVFGYSNGANIASSILFHYKKAFKAAILSHPMIPFKDVHLPDLADLDIFIGAGSNDPLTTLDETNQLKEIYEHANAKVSMYLGNFGHSLSKDELDEVIKWYKTLTL